MSKKKTGKNRLPKNVAPTAAEAASPGGGWHTARETIESIVIAFVLAFLFRTFEAEAFVIPTGSMSPSLLGRHKDVDCSQCGYRFRTTASTEGEEYVAMQTQLSRGKLSLGERERLKQRISSLEVVAGLCPMCRQPLLFRDDNLPSGMPPSFDPTEVNHENSYPGDRILVNKYSYASKDPDRWDVVVFKFPGNGEMNYIKRLVGLPNETLRVFQGDVFIRSNEPGAEFRIERKPVGKVRAMLQEVHDTDYDPAILVDAGWPLRWEAAPNSGWQIDTKPEGQVVKQRFTVKGNDDMQTAWLRYRHFVPSEYDWDIARRFRETGQHKGISRQQWIDEARPELISDFNAYNARILRGQLMHGPWQFEPHQLGVQWVSDLAVECEVDVQKSQGEMVLDLVEAGRHFLCRIDLKTGNAALEIDGDTQFHPTASTSLNSTGKHDLLFANVDDQLLLWVDGDVADFGDTTFDADQLFGDRKRMVPVTSDTDAGDLAPAGIGARGATLTVNRLKILRDIYYVAAKWDDPQVPSRLSRVPGYFTDYLNPGAPMVTEDGTRLEAVGNLRRLFRDPKTWPRFATRKHRDFPIDDNQFFVMGDNSPESQDCRLWMQSHGSKGTPGGAYLDRRLLTGKAICVFWPHSWGSIPGLQMLPGFPGFGDMRLVR